MAKAKVQKGKKRSKGSTAHVGQQGKAEIATAIESLREAHEKVFAIEEVGQWLPQLNLADGICLRLTLETLCGGAKDWYCEAMDAIAHLKHPATAFLLKACESLDVITLVVEARDGNLSRAELRAMSRVTLTFLGESVRWMEQAEEALGVEHGFGWLNELFRVEGVPEGFRRLDERQWWVAHHFNRLKGDQQQVVADFITTALKDQQ